MKLEWLKWAYLAAALLSTALGQVTYKMYFQHRRLSTVMMAIAFFAAAPVFAFMALRELTIGMVYMATALTQVLVLGLSRNLLHEKITRDHLVAAVFIIAGVTLYGWSS